LRLTRLARPCKLCKHYKPCKPSSMKFNIITIFPNIINSYFSETILARAIKNGIIKINAINLRDFADDKHQKVDDTTYGGGAGMILKPEPVFIALKSLEGGLQKVLNVIKKITNSKLQIPNKKRKIILLSPRGKQFDQRMAEEFAKLDEITFVCGRYEGVDQRVADYMVDEEISVGPYVLAGGELGALVMIESISRLLKGVLGNEESLMEETFNMKTLKPQRGPLGTENIKTNDVIENVEYGQYTKPAEFNGWKVPEVLLSGNHGEIEKWRKG